MHEYYTMVDFIRPGYLGSLKEFKTRFQEPIENGQATDSHVDALTQAKKRSFVLRHELSDIVLRRDANFLKSLL